jgi:hypothetical protein
MKLRFNIWLCDDELEDDFEEILSQVLHHDVQEVNLKLNNE